MLFDFLLMLSSKKFVIKRGVPCFVHFFLFLIYHNHWYMICLLITLLPLYILLHHIPTLPHRTMVTRRRPQVTRAPLLKLRKSIPQHFATPPFYPLRYPANRILRRIFYEQMNVVNIHSHVYNLDIQFFTGFPDDFFCRFRNFTEQNLPAILRRKYQMVC